MPAARNESIAGLAFFLVGIAAHFLLGVHAFVRVLGVGCVLTGLDREVSRAVFPLVSRATAELSPARRRRRSPGCAHARVTGFSSRVVRTVRGLPSWLVGAVGHIHSASA